MVRIDRRTRWGNPFVIGRDGTREDVIARYRRWLWRRIGCGEVGLEDLARLHGKSLVCWCHPLPCHGHALARAAEWAVGTLAAGGPLPMDAKQAIAGEGCPPTPPSRPPRPGDAGV